MIMNDMLIPSRRRIRTVYRHGICRLPCNLHPACQQGGLPVCVILSFSATIYLTTSSSPKLIPWFVSDVLPVDFVQTLEVLSDPTFFSDLAVEDAARQHLETMVKRWKSYVDQGIFQLSVPLDTPLGADQPMANFWTSPHPYWNLQEHAPELFKELQASGLVIFKGDLK